MANLNKEFVLKWLSHAIIVAATVANAFDFVPLNKVLFLLGCVLWTWVGLIWRQPSLWTLNIFCGLIYVIGLIK
jgi:hypothetical protein